jgi:GNAT superfamily N-acetyltransferase
MIFDLNKLEILVSEEKREENYLTMTFFANYLGDNIGWLIIDRYYGGHSGNKHIKKNYFKEGIGFPYILSMNVEKIYRGKGVMSELLDYANEYWKEKGYVLHSGISNERLAVSVFEKFVDVGKMEKIKIDGKDRYKFKQ